MIKYAVYLLLFAAFAIYGCAIKEPKEQQSKFIVMKTPQVKFADMGFVSNYDNRVNIQIYSSGEAITSLDIYKDKICVSSFECISKQEFYKNRFGVLYPDDTLEKIFLGKPIFDGFGMIKIDNGFTQHIFLDEKYDITYSVVNGDILFNDKIRKILIKVQKR